MKNLDKKIQEALGHPEGVDVFSDEPNIAEEVLQTFRGRHRWILGMAVVCSTVVLIITIWAGYRFTLAELPHDQLRWGGLCLLGVLIVSFIKVYFWLEMHTNRILREIKRLELRFLERTGRID